MFPLPETLQRFPSRLRIKSKRLPMVYRALSEPAFAHLTSSPDTLPLTLRSNHSRLFSTPPTLEDCFCLRAFALAVFLLGILFLYAVLPMIFSFSAFRSWLECPILSPSTMWSHEPFQFSHKTHDHLQLSSLAVSLFPSVSSTGLGVSRGLTLCWVAHCYVPGFSHSVRPQL